MAYSVQINKVHSWANDEFQNLKNAIFLKICKLSTLGKISIVLCFLKVSKKAKVRNRCNQVPHLTQDTTLGSDKAPKHHIQESQKVSSFPVGNHNAGCNEQTKMHDKHET